MRILHIDTEMTWRGGENQLRLLLEGLAATDVENYLAVRPGSLAAARLARHAQMLQVPMRGGIDPLASYRIAQYCQAKHIDLIDAHTANAHSLALLAKAFCRRQGPSRPSLVVHRRVDYAPSASWINRRKYLSPHIDRFIAISGAIRSVLIAYGVPATRITVVKSAIRTDGYRDEERPAARAALAQAFGVNPEVVFIGNASALTPQKGYEVLLDAAAILKRQGAPFHLFIAGDGELQHALERQRLHLGLDNHVTFLGFVKEVPQFLSGLDILAVPSRYEGLGTILLEGLAAGLAVAATAVGGIPEVIEHQVSGLLSANEDADGLALNLNLLIADPALRAKLNAAGRAHIAAEFSLAAMVGGNLEVYRQLVR